MSSTDAAPDSWVASQAEGPPVVTLAALYGAEGDTVGARVAERLGVPFLDRAIPAAVAKRTGDSEQGIAAVDESAPSGVDRLARRLARVSAIPTSTPPLRLEVEEGRMTAEINSFIADAASGGGVVLGRGGAVVLRSVRRALHVYLRSSRDARLAHVMAREGVDRVTARRRMDVQDRARRAYVRRATGADGEDRGLYDLEIDALALGIDTAVEVILAAVGAARSREEEQ